MSFWTENSLEPRRSFRFRLGSVEGLELSDTGRNPYWWNAKKVDKPSFSISSNKYRLINHEINVPGIVSWNPISMEIVDVGKTVNSLLEQLQSFGYAPDTLDKDSGLSKAKGLDTIGNIRIEQIKGGRKEDGGGKVLESWSLEGAFITELRLGNLDYSSDELVTINITITYDYAYLTDLED